MEALDLFKLFGWPKIGGVIIEKHLELFERMGETQEALVDSGLIAASSFESSASPETPGTIETKWVSLPDKSSLEPPSAIKLTCTVSLPALLTKRGGADSEFLSSSTGSGGGSGGMKGRQRNESRKEARRERQEREGSALTCVSDLFRKWQLYCGRADGAGVKCRER